ncbi:MAG: DNA repair protein RecO [Bacteroidota bacterium]
MLQRTRGIVFNTFKYSDSGVIAKVYTEQFGLQSYLINSVHGKKAATRAAVLQPLTLAECVVYHKERRQLNRVREIKCEHPYLTIPHDIFKSSILLFLNEILYKSIREEEKNPGLFEFIYTSLRLLDLKTDNCSNFHLFFMTQLTRYLGFFPDGRYSAETPYFDLQAGSFKMREPAHPLYLDKDLSEKFSELTALSHAGLERFRLSNQQRKALLGKLITYYELHLASIQDIRSHKVLEDIF